MSRRRAAIGVGAALLALLAALWSARPRPGGVADSGEIEVRAVARGVVEPTAGVVKVRASIAGTARRVAVRPGDRVEVDAPLCTILGGPGEMPTTVRATTAGVVVARYVEPGDVVADLPPQLLFEIADVEALRVRIEIEAADAPAVALGQAVTLTAPGGGDVVARGTIEQLSSALDARSIGIADPRLRADAPVRQGWIAIAGDRPPLLVRQELEAVIALPAHQAEVRVPRGAIQVRDGWATVRVLDGLLGREARVTLGASDVTHVEVQGIAVGTPLAAR